MSYTPPDGDAADFSWYRVAPYKPPKGDAANFSWSTGRADLIFKQPPVSGMPVKLLFGNDDAPPPIPDVTVTASGKLTGLRGRVRAVIAVVVATPTPGRLTGLRGRVRAVYDVNVDRSDSVIVTQHYQDADGMGAIVGQHYQDTLPLQVTYGDAFQEAVGMQASVAQHWQDTLPLYLPITQRFQEADRMMRSLVQGFQEGLSLQRAQVEHFQEALPLKVSASQRFQQGINLYNSASQRFQEATPLEHIVGQRFWTGVPLNYYTEQHYQEADYLHPGRTYYPPEPPEPWDPCYLPTLPVKLVFKDPWSGAVGNAGVLLFTCERHPPEPPDGTVVIPVRRVYYMINSAALYRMPGDVFIKANRMQLSLDVDSWTYTFSATIDARYESALDPNNDGTPVVLHAIFNGELFKLILKSKRRNRSFAQSSITITGMGWSASLDKPHSGDMNFTNASNRTAQQLMADVLTLNGVGIGWDVEWNLQDWDVPAKALAHQGTYVSALNHIVTAAGGYMQPHPNEAKVRAMARFPEAPWNWHTLTPDIELPVEFTSVEDIEWTDKPVYNRVFVAGTNEYGIVRDVNRDGTAGDLVATMQTHALMTHLNAARQLGQTILSEVGAQRLYTLKTPVHPLTGIIHPGKFIKYVDNGIDRVGISRAVMVESNFPEMWQTIEVETYVNP